MIWFAWLLQTRTKGIVALLAFFSLFFPEYLHITSILLFDSLLHTPLLHSTTSPLFLPQPLPSLYIALVPWPPICTFHPSTPSQHSITWRVWSAHRVSIWHILERPPSMFLWTLWKYELWTEHDKASRVPENMWVTRLNTTKTLQKHSRSQYKSATQHPNSCSTKHNT